MAGATTSVVLMGAPANEAASTITDDDPCPARPSRGRRWVMWRPRVRTTRHPPRLVPRVSAAAASSSTHSGTAKCDSRPPPTRARVTRPMVFWASFDPWA